MSDVSVLDVFLHQQRIGALAQLPNDRSLFSFHDDYIRNPNRPTLSLSFHDAFGALNTELQPTQTRLLPFFSNLLPEGPLREYLATRAGVKPQREFLLLWVLGRDLPGAITVEPAEAHPRPEDVPDATLENTERPLSGPLRFSLAGVQLKFSAILNATGGLTIPVDGAGGAWIVKLPSAVFAHVPENEFAMMELARRVGIDVPETKLVPIDDIAGLPDGIARVGPHAFAIKRFDRTDSGERIHMEDFGQIYGVYPEKKYDKASYQGIAKVIWTEVGEEGIVEFVRRLVFNVLIGNADMHLKNWSLLYPDTRAAALAPAYDFVSTIAYLPEDALALSFMGSKDFAAVDLGQFRRFAAKARLPEKVVMDTVRDTIDAFHAAWASRTELAMDPHLTNAIESHLPSLPLWPGD